MKHSSVLLLSLVAAASCITSVARADSFAYSIDGVASTILTPSADTLSLNANSGFLNLTPGLNSSVYLQDAIFTAGDSGSLVQNVQTVLAPQNFTIDGVTQSIVLTVEDDVTQSADTLHVIPSTYSFNTADGTFAVSFTDFATPPALTSVGQQDTVSMNADITYTPSGSPEPFTIGIGIAGVGLAVRRRIKAKASI